MALSIGVGVKEVEHESLHRAASELSSIIFRYKNKTVEEATAAAFEAIATKYLTGVEDRDIIFDRFGFLSFFSLTLQTLRDFFRLARDESTLEMEVFRQKTIALWQRAASVVPIAHLFNRLAGGNISKPESIRFLTGNVLDPFYREYAFATKYPALKFYMDSYHKFRILGSELTEEEEAIVDELCTELKEGMRRIHPEVIEFNASVFATLVSATSIAEVLDYLTDLIYIKVRSWAMRPREDVIDLFSGVFGSTESLRLELKYSGISTDVDDLNSALDKLNKYLELGQNVVPQTTRPKTEMNLSEAIEKIATMRGRKVSLETNLQKKTFVQSLTPAERDIFFRGLTGQTFREYVSKMVQFRNMDVAVDALDEMRLDDVYQKLFKTDAVTTMYHALAEEPQTSKVMGSGRESLQKLADIQSLLSKERGNQVKTAFDNKLKLRALVNGLSDDELTRISKILFNTLNSTKDEVLGELTVLVEQSEKAGKDADLTEVDQKEEATNRVKDFCLSMIRYSLSPALTCFDIALDMINWTKENVNDVFLSLDSDDLYQQNQGKIVIHSLVLEGLAVFAVLREDSRLTAAFLSSLITREKGFVKLLEELSETSLMVEVYAGVNQAFPQDASPWSVANEVWARHLAREKRPSMSDVKKIVQKLNPEEKARRAYQMAEGALSQYTVTMRSKQNIGFLTIKTEDTFLEFLKFLRQHGVKELMETPFQIAETLDMGSVVLRDAITQIIHPDYAGRFQEILGRLESDSRLDENTLLDITARTIDLLNRSMMYQLETNVSQYYLTKIHDFCSKHENQFVSSLYTTAEHRAEAVKKIIHEVGVDFIALLEEGEQEKQLSYFNGVFDTIFENDVVRYLKQLNEAGGNYDKLLEDFGHYLWTKGVKRNTFTVLLNQLLREYNTGRAEIAIEYWRRYADRCRYIIKRLDKTCSLIKG